MSGVVAGAVAGLVVAGAVSGLVWFVVPSPFSVGAGVAAGLVVAHAVEARRSGRTVAWRRAVAQGIVAGLTAVAVVVWLQP